MITCARKSCGPQGFTLIELLVVLTLAAILLMVGVPSFRESVQRNRFQSARGDVVSSLNIARVEAMTRVRPVSLCASVDLASCSGSAWETGALIFVDDGAGTGTAVDGQLGGGEELLRIVDPAPVGVTIRTLNFPTTSSIVFLDDGRIQQSGGTITVCDDRGAAEARGVIVVVTGAVRLTLDPTPANGVDDPHLDDSNDALVCP